MKKSNSDSTRIDIDTASIKEVFEVVGNILKNYGMIEFKLSTPIANGILKSELKSLKDILRRLDVTNFRLNNAKDKVSNNLLLGTIQETIFEIENSKQNLLKTIKSLPIKIKGFEKFAASMDSDQELVDSLKKLSKKPQIKEANLNELLFQLSKALGGPTALYKLFKKFPELTPPSLPASFNVDSLRKRIQRFKKKPANN